MSHKPDHLIVSRGRRRFLAGAAGLLALPFLESLQGTLTAASWTPAPGMPKRLAIFFHGHGTIMEEFLPGPNFAMRPILQPVADAGLTQKMLVVSGVNSKTQSGHPGAPSLLTCAPLEANQYNITHATTPSVDHIIAQHMQDGGLSMRLDLGVHEDSTNPMNNGISNGHTRTYWSGNNELIDTIIKPEVAHNRLFPGGAGQPMEPGRDARAARRKSVLDGVLQRFNALQGRVSASDRVRLEQHATRVRELEQSIDVQPPAPTGPACGEGPDLGPFDGVTHERVAEQQVDLLAHALACNQADVGTFKVFDMPESSWGHINHPDLAQTFAGEGFHGAWHRASDDGLAYARRAFTPINRWYGSLFARLLSRLDAIDEGDGTALDNTMVVWLSDFGHGGGHSADNLHIAFAGNVAGARLGRHINYADTYNRDAASSYGDDRQPGNHNLAVTMTQAFGISGDRFGDYTNVRQPVSPGPLDLS